MLQERLKGNTMARPRTNDPSNLSCTPNPTSDPKRQEELISEFKNRLQFLTQSYAASQKVVEGGDTFNESLERLRRSLTRTRILKRRGKRLHREIEMLVSLHARRMAEAEGVDVNISHIRAGGQHVVRMINSLRGRPENPMLEFHVTGLVALIQEFSGLPVLSQREKDSVYEPHFPEGISQIVPIIVQKWDQSITTTQLVNLVRKIRKKYAGKPLRFHELFPLYGASMNNTEIVPPPGISVEIQNLNIPIYCP